MVRGIAMDAVRIETKVKQNGRVVLDGLPFEEGQDVEVIVLESHKEAITPSPNPLKGSVLRYDDPFEPAVPPEDWEAVR
jgi:hypothetical protein